MQYTGRRSFNGIDQEMAAFLKGETSYDEEDQFGIASECSLHRFLIHRFRLKRSRGRRRLHSLKFLYRQPGKYSYRYAVSSYSRWR